MAQPNLPNVEASWSTEKDPDISRYRDYTSILGIAAEEIIHASPIQDLLLKTIFPGLALRFDYALILKRLFDARGITPRGVLHLGGHRGEEILVYVGLGFKTIAFVEPDPKCYADLKSVTELVERTAGMAGDFLSKELKPKILAVNAAAGDEDGEGTLYRTAFSPANSMLKPESSKDWMRVEDTVRVETVTVDTLLNNLGRDVGAADFNVMRLNIQGGELLALHGAERTLASMDLVYVEINFDDRYRNSPTSSDLEAFMDRQGFMPVERYRYSRQFEAVGDILFVRK
jgi:FkbM family methyltransferase